MAFEEKNEKTVINKYFRLFSDGKPVIGMLHSREDENLHAVDRAKFETEIYLRSGVDALLVENYYGSEENVEMILRMLSNHYSTVTYGVNILRDYKLSFELAQRYNARFIQIDSVCGHLCPEDDIKFADELGAMRNKYNNIVVLGGVWFKYQRLLSKRSLSEDIVLGMNRCDAVVVTGEKTGSITPIEKIMDFRDMLGKFPLVVGAGVTPGLLKYVLPLSDGLIVGSYFKYKHFTYNDVSEENVQRLMLEKNKITNGTEELFSDIIKFTGEYSFLSMKYFSQINFIGMQYNNTAAAWLSQAMDEDKRFMFSRATAHQARRLFNLYNNCQNWNIIQYERLYEVCKARFRQNPELAKKLLDTGRRQIIYDTTGSHNNILGSCRCKECRAKEFQNIYGKILMKIREEMRKQN